MYFEVGNLNTETYPSSANLPTYVRENYGFDGNRSTYNIDRIIISYQMDYYRDMQVFQGNAIGDIYYPEPSAQQMLNVVQTCSGSAGTAEQTIGWQFCSDAFHQQQNVTIPSFSYDPQVYYAGSVNPYSSRLVDIYDDLQYKYRRHGYWPCRWVQPYEGFWEEAKKRNGGSGGGGFGFIKLLLGAGALYLAVKCFGWLRDWWEGGCDENILNMIPWRTPTYKHTHTHIMLDYVY
ncbi:uncharacterized protein [Channa argus]|uniref:uncharacterized protein n=1 Tax=Channa argus TaxID=215402 RepID=UPI0035207415